MSRESELRERQNVEAIIIKKAWDDPEFRQRLRADPRAAVNEVLRALDPDAGLADDVTIRVVEETPTELCLVLPLDPASLEDETDLLEEVSGAGCGNKVVSCDGKCGIRFGCNDKVCVTKGCPDKINTCDSDCVVRTLEPTFPLPGGIEDI